MSDEPASPVFTVRNARELLPISEITSVETHEVRGQRLEPDPNRESSHDLQVMARLRGEHELETRVRMTQITRDARLYADIGVVFTITGEVEIEQEAMREFIERVGVMAVFPFLRESVYTSASRIGVEAPVVGLLRAGEFRLSPPAEGEDREGDE